jgi:hypothetical protein
MPGKFSHEADRQIGFIYPQPLSTLGGVSANTFQASGGAARTDCGPMDGFAHRTRRGGNIPEKRM